jgi:hypothetical protein
MLALLSPLFKHDAGAGRITILDLIFMEVVMTRILLCGLLVAGLAIAGCSEPAAPAEPIPPTDTAAPAPAATSAQGIIPQGQLDAMAKAAATSSVLEQAEQERRKQMEAQGL